MANEKETNNAPEREAKNSEFLRSLDDFSPEAQEVSASKKRAFKGSAIVPTIAIILCLTIFFYSSYLLIKIWIDNESSGELYTDISGDLESVDLSRNGDHAVKERFAFRFGFNSELNGKP